MTNLGDGERLQIREMEKGDELPNFGDGRVGPPSRFLVSVDSGGDEVLWNQHLCKC